MYSCHEYNQFSFRMQDKPWGGAIPGEPLHFSVGYSVKLMFLILQIKVNQQQLKIKIIKKVVVILNLKKVK